jgi:predicted RNA-binding protein with PUA-like domain
VVLWVTASDIPGGPVGVQDMADMRDLYRQHCHSPLTVVIVRLLGALSKPDPTRPDPKERWQDDADEDDDDDDPPGPHLRKFERLTEELLAGAADPPSEHCNWHFVDVRTFARLARTVEVHNRQKQEQEKRAKEAEEAALQAQAQAKAATPTGTPGGAKGGAQDKEALALALTLNSPGAATTPVGTPTSADHDAQSPERWVGGLWPGLGRGGSTASMWRLCPSRIVYDSSPLLMPRRMYVCGRNQVL